MTKEQEWAAAEEEEEEEEDEAVGVRPRDKSR